MTDNLCRSISSGNGSSQNIPQGIIEDHDPTTVEVADSPERQSDLALDIQALQILDSSDDCIKVLDLEGRILFMSRGGQVLLGIQDIAPFLNTSWIEFWQGADRQAASEAIAQARAGKVCTFQGYCPTPSSEPKWWECKVTPMRGIDGQVSRLLCISRDITNRKQAEAALRASEEQFRLFTAATSDTVYKMSADWREMRLLEGKNFLASTQGPNQTWLEQYIPVEEQALLRAAIKEAIHTKSTFELEHRVIRLDGTIGWTFSRAIPLLNDQNEIVEWLGAASDVTERKQAEATIAADLRDTRLLHDLTMQVASDNQEQDLFQSILDTAIALMQSDMGSLQILDRERNELHLQVWRGFHPDAAAFWQTVRVDGHSTCSVALHQRERVIVANVETCDFLPGTADLDYFRLCGIKAVQSTPLLGHSGQFIGMISTHWRKPYSPSDPSELGEANRQLRFLDLLARQAADLIEQRQAEAALRESEAKYRTLFDTMGQGYCELELIRDAEGRAVDQLYLELNPAFEWLLGIPVAEAKGRRASEVLNATLPLPDEY